MNRHCGNFFPSSITPLGNLVGGDCLYFVIVSGYFRCGGIRMFPRGTNIVFVAKSLNSIFIYRI